MALADAVEREMDQLGIGDFHVAGYSLGARVSFELAIRGRIRLVVAIAPDGLGTPPERVYQATALMAGRAMATLLAPVATLVTASAPGRSLFFATERSRPWKLTRQDARQQTLEMGVGPMLHRSYAVRITASSMTRRHWSTWSRNGSTRSHPRWRSSARPAARQLPCAGAMSSWSACPARGTGRCA